MVKDVIIQVIADEKTTSINGFNIFFQKRHRDIFKYDIWQFLSGNIQDCAFPSGPSWMQKKILQRRDIIRINCYPFVYLRKFSLKGLLRFLFCFWDVDWSPRRRGPTTHSLVLDTGQVPRGVTPSHHGNPAPHPSASDASHVVPWWCLRLLECAS